MEYYSNIYKRDFLRENQDDNKILIDGGTGCKSNPKDSFFVDFHSSNRIDENEIMLLTN